MKRINFKATGTSNPAASYTQLRGALNKLDTASARCPDEWIRSDDAPDDGTSLPFATNAAPTERRNVNTHRAANEFILQKEPDGHWHLDRWNDDAAGAPRPESAFAPQADESLPNNASGVCFIIEIG
ncbi:MAG: hypothetical protein H7335_07725 [Massilia sp.]|nr:hypothetical protein [Massilia sp.]